MAPTNQAPQTHMVPIAKYLAWLRRLSKLEQELPKELTQEQWLGTGRPIRYLLVELITIGEVSGALVPFVRDQADGTIQIGQAPSQDFDWVNGEIDFQAQQYHWNDGVDRATPLIARIVEITGFPEQDGP